MMIKMGATTHRRTSISLNVLTATSGLTILAGCLLAIDERVRDQVAQIVTGHGPTGELGGTVWHTERTFATLAELLRDQSLTYAPLTIFGLAAIVLVLFMTRT